ncbi:uncharacterized protein LACBIDRAFT_305382 [Laccaria bicolor S238N-H82]|uniref:Predicted protein n=1 Tax=Laccaria bicolor (strain S238N-H82 / ATCC MYA-4686) TaxID=486041 RepID=B0CU36_LACBS|nr:uncharacterized protein LACBIDRAFT_305382 [Laccaria bicolor S238N-H82]EDR14026.1 predicted protein [Laccaria bicolor S238N-H82]|eukprot:XP_001874585.1 predicted protein [Laccaria bicolor S238N-H82]
MSTYLTKDSSLCSSHIWNFRTLEQTDRPVAAVITHLRDIIVCIRLYLHDSYRFFIFNPHRQPKHPRGPAFVLNDSKETAARYLHELLQSDDSSDGEVEEFHSNSQTFSAHILRMETSERWRLALLSICPCLVILWRPPTPPLLLFWATT